MAEGGKEIKVNTIEAQSVALNVHEQYNVYGNNSTPEKVMTIEEIKRSINDATRRIPSTLEDPILDESDNRVYPKLYDVKFYLKKPEINLAESPDEFQGTPLRQDGERIEPDKLFEDLDGKPVRMVAVVGGAGYGKSELLRRFSHMVLDKSIDNLRKIEVVYHVRLSCLNSEKEMTVGQLLLSAVNPEFNLGTVHEGIDWILKNQEKVLFVFDGVDQYPKALGEARGRVTYTDKARPTEILDNLLEGHIFPRIRILISSREHGIQYFPPSMRPQRIVALAGFEISDIKKLVSLIGNDHIWNQIRQTTPSVLSICSIPLFLDLTVNILMEDPHRLPETISEILMQTLSEFILSDNTDKDTILDRIHDLKYMAFQGTQAGTVTFQRENLPGNLTFKEVSDLVVSLPGRNTRRRQRLLEGQFVCCFCHQTLQDALSALHTAELPVNEFANIVTEFLQSPKKSYVMRIVCGIILNRRTHDIATGEGLSSSLLRACKSVKEKREILMEAVLDQIERLQWRHELRSEYLELLTAVNECDSEINKIVKICMKRIDMSLRPISPNEMHVIGSTLGRCQALEVMNLHWCNLTPDLHKILVKSSRNSRAQIEWLVISGRVREVALRMQQEDTFFQRFKNSLLAVPYMLWDMLKFLFDAVWSYLSGTKSRAEVEAEMKALLADLIKRLKLGQGMEQLDSASELSNLVRFVSEAFVLWYKFDEENLEHLQQVLDNLPRRETKIVCLNQKNDDPVILRWRKRPVHISTA